MLCYFFPKDGFALGKFSFRFASLEEVLGSEDEEKVAEPELSPEELLEMQRQAALSAKGDSLESYLLTNNIRFHFPENDLTFFDSLFAELENADKKPVRVIHYGDSQLEEDRITNVFRDTLQKHFGGDGQGMMPARKYYTFSTGASSTAEGDRYMVYANRASGNKYGPYGDFVRMYGGSTRLSYYQSGRKDVMRKYFNEVTVLAGNTQSDGLKITCGDSTVRFPAGKDYVRAVFSVPEGSARVNINVTGAADLYGVLLDNKTGVSVDNVPMRGCSGTIFTSLNADQLKTFYRDENVKLILLQFGGNRVPSLKTSENISKFCSTISRQIKHVQSLAPEAKIVFVGPSDMATSVKGKMQTYPILPELIDSLRNTANSAGAAYWDIYSAMGGKNSMVQWVKSSPALAGGDYVHFTPKGSIRMGELISTSFIQHYNHYVWRKEHEE